MPGRAFIAAIQSKLIGPALLTELGIDTGYTRDNWRHHYSIGASKTWAPAQHRA